MATSAMADADAHSGHFRLVNMIGNLNVQVAEINVRDEL